MMQILKEKNTEFGSFNILMDEEVRQGEYQSKCLSVKFQNHLFSQKAGA